MILPFSFSIFLISPYLLVGIFLLFLLVGLFWNLELIAVYFPLLALTIQQKKPVEKILFLIIVSGFTFILFNNLLGFLPYATTITSQLSLTLLLAIWLVGGIVINAVDTLQWSLLQYFLPKQTANPLAWLLIPIEVISFLIRPLSLALRLFANTVCGHILMKLAGTCIITMFHWWAPLAIFTAPFFFLGLFCFEFFIACLQAYIFILLFTIYHQELNIPAKFSLSGLITENLFLTINFIYLEEFWWSR